VIPLVIALHCLGCPPSYVPDKLGLDALAKKHHFAVAAPASGHVDKRGESYWNATAACCDFDGKKPDDVGAILALIDDQVKQHHVDAKRVYLVGFSNGAFLAWRIACDHADKVAAIVAIGGAAPATCAPSSPVAVLEVHGRDDDVVPLAGGKLGGGLPQLATVPPAKDALQTWARVDHCAVGAPGCRAQQWVLPGGHWPTVSADFGERVWTWVAAQHK
jgi:polyhydroxybutyrate depolymerase